MTNFPKNIGEKAKNLLILQEQFPSLIPRFEVIEISSIFTNWTEINTYLNKLAAGFLKGNVDADRYENERNKLFDLLDINKSIVTRLNKKLRELNFHKVSYRTSALFEDMKFSSFAGQYVTLLDEGIDGKTIEKCSKACAISLFSLRVLEYIKAQGYADFQAGGSIIIQEMFYGKASGVLFTENGCNQMDLAYTKTWRNTTVDGGKTDNFTFNKSTKNINKELPDDLPKTILKIFKAAAFLEQKESMPLDIEWSVSEKKAAILQFRPITVSQLDYEIEWDNTNIAESYPGITLPLTYSFIRRLYAKVYPEFLKLLGKSDTELSDKSDIFDNMLGYINGRVYYNINNWYKLVALLPGYKYNKDFFEAMLMPAKKKPVQKIVRKKIPFRAKINLGLTFVRFIWLLLQANRLSDKFTKNYLNSYIQYRSVQWEKLTAPEMIKLYSKIEKDLLQQWAVPILNDFRTMIFHGILKKMFFPQNNNDVYIQLLSGIYDHTSIEPIRELGFLAQEAKKILAAHKGDQKKTAATILTEKKYEKIRGNIKKYLEKYGGRSPDELKLENPRLSENFADFVSFIISCACGYSPTNILTGKRTDITMKNASDGKSSLKSILIRPFFSFVLFQAKSGISKRERFRFYRAQVFGIARDVHLALGKRFVDAEILATKNDIFYLTISEIQDIIQGHSFDNSFKSKIKERKKLFADYAKQNPGRRVISSGLIAPLKLTIARSDNELVKDKLTGMGVSKGIFEGEVIVIKKFDPEAEVKGKILVTEHTDPGWTLLFLNAAALIVERGNALSHASIVSRELGIPAVVGVENACSQLKNKDRVFLNGNTGEISILGRIERVAK